jgi:8-oxo-dGTP pyrophosphatase MutT (NUDIX family)
LLEKRSDCGLWGLPGGRIDAGESAIEAAVREVLEETGLQVRVTGLVGVYSEPATRIVVHPDNVVQLVDIILSAEIVGGELKVSAESEELRFFDPKDPPDNIVPPAMLPLADVANGVRGVVR